MVSIDVKQFRDFDWLTAFLAIAIVLFGVAQIYNAKPDDTIWQKQLVGLAIGVVAMVAVGLTDYRKIVDYAPILYVIGIILLLLVLVPGLGVKINGQQAWLKIPFFGRFQPSEFVKIPTVLMLAKYFGARRVGFLKFHEVAIGCAILGLPTAAIMLEPDAGQTLTYFPLLAVVLFLSAIRMRYVIVAILATLIFVPASYVVGVQTGFIKGYQRERIEVITDPEKADPRGYGYHTFQSIITVGKGKLTGIEDEELSQSQLKFLPEANTDFIFAVTAENTGFLGSISLLLAYALLLSRMILAARQAPDRTGMLIIMATVGGMTFQIFMNMGMVLGFLPVIGVPLPLMSSGLSAILTTFIAIGFTISVRMRRFVN